MNNKRELVKAVHFKLNDTEKRRPKKRRKEEVERDVITRGLQRVDA